MGMVSNPRTRVGAKFAKITSPKDEDLLDLGEMFAVIVNGLPYYNAIAKNSEISKYQPGSLAAAIKGDPDFAQIARVDGELAGFCFSQKDDGLIWLSWFGVSPKYRRQGIGRALLAALERRARSCRSHKIWCDSRTDNAPSCNLLNRSGFRPICKVTNHWYGQDFILWERYIGY
jgi:ribosomal protein S18 acetylase RimI-like enzyme